MRALVIWRFLNGIQKIKQDGKISIVATAEI